MDKRLALRPLLLLACAAVPGARATAQAPAPAPTPTPAPTRSEYIEVTETRIPEDPADVPVAIEVFGGDELTDRGATDLRSALALATGVDISPGGDAGPAGSVPEFWGLREFDAFLLVVDGVPWGGPFNPALTTLNLGDLDRVEVLRGPAPVMYGATSFVGVIQVIHANPADTKTLVRATGGSYGSFGGEITAKLPDWGGFQSALSVDGRKQGYKDDRTEFGRGHLLWRNYHPLSNGSFRFNVDGTFINQDPASPRPRQGPVLSPLVPPDANQNPAGAFLNDRRYAFSLGYDRPLGSATWESTLSYTRSSNDIFRGFLADISLVDPNAVGFRENIDINEIYFDTHATWTVSPKAKIVAGLDYIHGGGEAEGVPFDYFTPLNSATAAVVPEPEDLDIFIEDKRDFGGAYAFASWDPAASLRLEAGIRLNVTSEKREMRDTGPDAPPEAEEGEENEQNKTRPSGSIGINWTPWREGENRFSLFANYKNTFKPAAFDFGIGEEEGGEEGLLKPETSNSFEVGIKTRFMDGKGSLEIAAFQMDFENLVISQVNDEGLPELINAGKERFKGIETGVAYRVAGQWQLRASYSFHDAKFRSFLTEFDGVPTQLAGKRLEMSARHLASAGILYAPSKGPLVSLEYNYVGDRYLNKRNTALADSYGTVSASLGYRAKGWELRVDGRNLNDARDPVSESELGDAQYYLLTARQFDVTLTKRF
jgi:iron complex outermembrane receptor protein